MVLFHEPWYLRRNKYLFSYEVPEFQILESEFQFSDSPDIGIQKLFSDRNFWNQKRNWNSASDGVPEIGTKNRNSQPSSRLMALELGERLEEIGWWAFAY